MKSIHIEIPSGKELQAHEVQTGLGWFCSWRRLSEVLAEARELRPNETLVSVQIDDRGLTFRVQSK